MVDDGGEEEDSKLPAVLTSSSGGEEDSKLPAVATTTTSSDNNNPSSLSSTAAVAADSTTTIRNNDDVEFSEFSIELEFDDGTIKRLVATENVFLENLDRNDVVIVGTSSSEVESIQLLEEFAEEVGFSRNSNNRTAAAANITTNAASASAAGIERRETGGVGGGARMMSSNNRRFVSPTTATGGFRPAGMSSYVRPFIHSNIDLGGFRTSSDIIRHDIGGRDVRPTTRYKTTDDDSDDDDDDDDDDSDDVDKDNNDSDEAKESADDDDDSADEIDDDVVPGLVERNIPGFPEAAAAPAAEGATTTISTAASTTASLTSSTALSWNVSSVVDMESMFDHATSFNQDLSSTTASLKTTGDNDNAAVSSTTPNRFMSTAERQRLIGGGVPHHNIGRTDGRVFRNVEIDRYNIGRSDPFVDTSRGFRSIMYHDMMLHNGMSRNHYRDHHDEQQEAASAAVSEEAHSSSLSSSRQRQRVARPAVASVSAARLPGRDVVSMDSTADEGRLTTDQVSTNVNARRATNRHHRMNRFHAPNLSTFAGMGVAPMPNPRHLPAASATVEVQEQGEEGQTNQRAAATARGAVQQPPPPPPPPRGQTRLILPPELQSSHEHTGESSRINNNPQPLRGFSPAPPAGRTTGMAMRHLSEMTSHMNMVRQRESRQREIDAAIPRPPMRMEEIMTPMNSIAFIHLLSSDIRNRAGSCDSSESKKEEPQIPLHKLECLSCDNNRRAEPPTEETARSGQDWIEAKAIADTKKPLTEDDPDESIKLIRVCCLRPIPSVVFKRLAGNLENLREIHVCDHWEDLSDEFGCRRPDVVVNRIFGCKQLMKSLQKLVIRCSFEELHHTYLRNLEDLELLRCHDFQRVRIITNATYTSNKLRRLHLRYCQSTQVLKDLLHIFPNIKELHLEACNADLSQIDFGKLLPKLESLKICLAMNVTALLPPSSKTSTEQSYGVLPKLHALKLEYMAKLELESLVMFISKYCPRLQDFSLRDDKLADQDIFEKFLDGLCGMGPSLLRTLRLGWNNDITRSTLNCRLQHEKNVKLLKTHGQLYRIEIMGDVMDGCPTSISPSPYDRYSYPATQRIRSALSALMQSNSMYENGRIKSLLKQNFYAVPFIGMQKYIKLWPNFIAAIGGKKTGKANQTKRKTDGNNDSSIKPDMSLQANCIFNFLRKDPTLTGHHHHHGHHLFRRENSFVSQLVQQTKENNAATATNDVVASAEAVISEAVEID